jgi:DNA polymerase
MKKKEKLRILRNEWDNCQRCDLYRDRHNVVHYRGKTKSKIFVIGEAPGKEEDLKGKPFVGKSGKVLDELINEFDCDFFIANTLACRPPNNRRPMSYEIRTCKERLYEMVRIIKPKVFIFLGLTPARYLAGITVLGPWKGKIVDFTFDGKKEYKAVITYHPSYYLRNRNKKLRNEILGHFKIAVEYLEK